MFRIIRTNIKDDEQIEEQNNDIKTKTELVRKICCVISLSLIVISLIIIIISIKKLIDIDIAPTLSMCDTTANNDNIDNDNSFIISPHKLPIYYDKIEKAEDKINDVLKQSGIKSLIDEANKLIESTNNVINTENKLNNQLTKQTNEMENDIINNRLYNIHHEIQNNKLNNELNNKLNHYSFTKINKKYNITKNTDDNIIVDEETNIESNIDKNDFSKLVSDIVNNSKINQSSAKALTSELLTSKQQKNKVIEINDEDDIEDEDNNKDDE